MDGRWQLGHMPADQYAIRARQAAKMMKDTDPSIELVACGSCGTTMPTYMEWDREVLDALGDSADYVSLHRYVGNYASDTADFLAVPRSVDRQIEEMDAACRFVQAKRRSPKRACLCFDEWNVWYKNHENNGRGQRAPHLLEEVYNLEDALVVAGFLNSFVRHADTVRIANIAQIVNVIAPVLTRGDELLIQTIFYPFEMFARRRKGLSLRVAAEGPGYESKSHGHTPFVDASAILDDDRLHLCLVNRSVTDPAPVAVECSDRAVTALQSAEVLTGPDPKAANSFEEPERVRSAAFGGVRVANGRAELVLPPLSVLGMTLGA
jgi:alpha-N-arabinofuranosidase